MIGSLAHQGLGALVVVEISEDGKAAKVLSTDGRMEVERGDKTDWLQRVAPLSGGGGGHVCNGTGGERRTRRWRTRGARSLERRGRGRERKWCS